MKCNASLEGIAKVVYTSKNGKDREVFEALDWLARLVTHIPDRYEQTVRYCGWYSNKSIGMRKKAETGDIIPAIMPNEMTSKESQQNWARLIQKIYEVDPLRVMELLKVSMALICPKCKSSMKIIAFIEELYFIEKFYAILNFGISTQP